MDHESAVVRRCAERYAAGELTDTEREQFEEHYFECARCAGDVRFEQAFAANMRQALRRPKSAGRAVRPAAWALALALPVAAGIWLFRRSRG